MSAVRATLPAHFILLDLITLVLLVIWAKFILKKAEAYTYNTKMEMCNFFRFYVA